MVALCGGGFTLRVTEGGHCADSDDSAGVMDVDFSVEPYQMLFVDVRCPLRELVLRGETDQITLLGALSFGAV